MAPYANQYRVDATFDETIDAVTDALSEVGFGVLADIDMQAAFENKLDEEYVRYRILAACNPPRAYDALDVEFELGTLLPCNVVVYETEEGETGVSVVDPRELMSIVDNEDLEPIVEDIADRLESALAAVPQARAVDGTTA